MPRWIPVCALIFLILAARADEGEESELWTETIRGSSGQFAVSVNGNEGSVRVLRGDQRDFPALSLLRVRMWRKQGEVVVALEKVAKEGITPRYQGQAKGWSGALTGFVLEKSDGKSWMEIGKFGHP